MVKLVMFPKYGVIIFEVSKGRIYLKTVETCFLIFWYLNKFCLKFLSSFVILKTLNSNFLIFIWMKTNKMYYFLIYFFINRILGIVLITSSRKELYHRWKNHRRFVHCYGGLLQDAVKLFLQRKVTRDRAR